MIPSQSSSLACSVAALFVLKVAAAMHAALAGK